MDLFGRKSNHDPQFARPIEDEDMFGLTDVVSERDPNFVENVQPLKTNAPQNPTTISQNPKITQLKQNIRETLLAKGRVAKPISLEENGMIDFEANHIDNQDQATVEPINKARLIFKHAEERRVKDKYGLYKGQKLTLSVYEDYIKKKICSDKRKQWDSFQKPPDLYDDEEELCVSD